MNIPKKDDTLIQSESSSQISKKKGTFCPECRKLGLNRRLRFYQITLDEAVELCENEQCLYPLLTIACEELVIKRNIEALSNQRKNRKRTNNSRNSTSGVISSAKRETTVEAKHFDYSLQNDSKVTDPVTSALDSSLNDSSSLLTDCNANIELMDLMTMLNDYASNGDPEQSTEVFNELTNNTASTGNNVCSLEDNRSDTVTSDAINEVDAFSNLLCLNDLAPNDLSFSTTWNADTSITSVEENIHKIGIGDDEESSSKSTENSENLITTVCAHIHSSVGSTCKQLTGSTEPDVVSQPHIFLSSRERSIKTYSKVCRTTTSNACSSESSSQGQLLLCSLLPSNSSTPFQQNCHNTISEIDLLSKLQNAQDVEPMNGSSVMLSGKEKAIVNSEHLLQTDKILEMSQSDNVHQIICSVSNYSNNEKDTKMTVTVNASSPNELNQAQLPYGKPRNAITTVTSVQTPDCEKLPKYSRKQKLTTIAMETNRSLTTAETKPTSRCKKFRNLASPKNSLTTPGSATNSLHKSTFFEPVVKKPPLSEKSLLSIATVAQRTCNKPRAVSSLPAKPTKRAVNSNPKKSLKVFEQPHVECLSILNCLEETPISISKPKMSRSRKKQDSSSMDCSQEWNKFSLKCDVNKWLGNKLQKKQFAGYKAIQKKVHDSGFVSEDSGIQSPSSNKSDESVT